MGRRARGAEWHLASKTDRSGGPDACWPWLGKTDQDGYGRLRIGREQRAHRIAWIAANGPIPEGLWVLHTCDNPPCLNPDHLFLGTNLDNIADKTRKGRAAGPGPGDRNHQSKLTPDQVIEIRRRYAGGGTTLDALAAEHGVAQATIQRLVKGTAWANVPAISTHTWPQ